MPRMDNTGPQGAGPMTGRGLGQCGMGVGWRQGARRGFGQGQDQRRGLLRYFWGNQPQDVTQRKLALEEYRDAIKEELADLEDELDNLDK